MNKTKSSLGTSYIKFHAGREHAGGSLGILMTCPSKTISNPARLIAFGIGPSTDDKYTGPPLIVCSSVVTVCIYREENDY